MVGDFRSENSVNLWVYSKVIVIVIIIRGVQTEVCPQMLWKTN